jgi:general secretion pathway protein E
MVSVQSLLIEKFNVSSQDIEKALEFQKRHPSNLEEIIANMGALDESLLPNFYSELLEMPISDEAINIPDDISSLLNQLPKAVADALVKDGWYPCAKHSLATSNPLSNKAIHLLESLDFEPEVLLISKDKSSELSRIFSRNDELSIDGLSNSEEERLRELASEAPVVNLFNTLINKALKARASDMHIEPSGNALRVRFRVDGMLHSEETLPKSLELALMTRLKILSSMDIAEKRRPQDGKIAYRIAQEELDIRVSCLPLNEGESVVLRFLRKGALKLELETLGIEKDLEAHILEDLKKTAGVILMTGPTGSGKTTSLYTFLNQLNDDKVKIVTLEDPVEYQLPGVNQVQVNSEIGYDFASGLRSIVRQDPDIIMVGEIRDKETAQIALQSALTGHLVFSTLHTNDAPSAYTRLRDLGVESFLLDAALVSIIAQRLVRTYCECSQPMEPEESKQIVAAYQLQDLAQRFNATMNLHKATGCSKCNHSGFSGRMAVIEYLKCDEQLSALDEDDDFLSKARALNRSRGARSLREDGMLKVINGKTSIEEVLRVAG